MVQQRERMARDRIAQARKPSGLIAGKDIQIAPDDFDEQQLAEVQEHASATRPPFARLGQRKGDQLRQSIAGRRRSARPQIERTWKGLEHGIERTKIAPQKSADDVSPVRTAAAVPLPATSPTASSQRSGDIAKQS